VALWIADSGEAIKRGDLRKAEIDAGNFPAQTCSNVMKAMVQAQELARRFNDDEAVWRSYERRRALRRLLGSRSPLADEILDDLDWQAAERECRAKRAIGFFQT
jgi:hypothetical protein